MFENDSIHSFQHSDARRSKVKGRTSATKQSKDDFIMDTNNSSIVSKRSVEKLYWVGEPEFFRYFVSKFKRRSPLINRGYWLRMRAVELSVERFLREPSDKHKVVVNLGCGYDPLPWLFFGKRPEICHNATFVDVDYPPLMQKKVSTIQRTPQLVDLLPGLSITNSKDGVLCRSDNYAAIGCDLRNLDFLSFTLREQLSIDTCKVAICFVAEVSTAYMEYEGSQAVLQWASAYDDVRFCLLEQHLPDGRDHPFAETMLKHFEKLRTPLHTIGTMMDMSKRFIQAGWPMEGVHIRSLWDFWSDDRCVSVSERQLLDNIEPFDEWEEFALFASHYFLLVACKPAGNSSSIYGSLYEDPSPTLPAAPKSTHVVTCSVLSSDTSQQRFSAVIPPTNGCLQFAIHAGLGTKERLSDAVTYSPDASTDLIDGPPLLGGLMCHTITAQPQGDCLLIGGRRSPAEVSTRCWLRTQSKWVEAEALPQGRYRHSAFAVKKGRGLPGVVVLGGRSGDGTILGDAMLWQKGCGWSALPSASATPPARFGATVLLHDNTGQSGLVCGGIGHDRVIHKDIWQWKLLSTGQIDYTLLNSKALAALGIMRPDLLWRFGAQSTTWNENDDSAHRILVGGISHAGILTRLTELYSLDHHTPLPISGPRPLLVGVSHYDDLCLGGGATCFSFGTYWNKTCRFVHQDAAQSTRKWRVLSKQRLAVSARESNPLKGSPGDGMPEQIPKVQSSTLNTAFECQQILKSRQPRILRGCDIGECTTRWTTSYLKDKIGTEREVSVHVASTARMDFRTKNFCYVKQNFGEFLDRADKGEQLYLRALSATAPSNDPTLLAKDFPEIAADFKLPDALAEVDKKMHSSPLRVSGRVAMWLHYDVMSNVLCQVRGCKRLLLFPPTDVVKLGFEAGASSSSFDAFNDRALAEARSIGCQPCEAILEPGDILFVPSLWLHTAAPTGDLSVAVNVFFRDEHEGYAAGRDVYGNRDLAAYDRGRKEVTKLARSFAGLPRDMAQFYLDRLAAELAALARTA